MKKHIEINTLPEEDSIIKEETLNDREELIRKHLSQTAFTFDDYKKIVTGNKQIDDAKEKAILVRLYQNDVLKIFYKSGITYYELKKIMRFE
jgi:hypothetical protein